MRIFHFSTRQLMDEPKPCSSVLSIQVSWMWDGCVEIVLGFDTKDGCVVVGAWLLAGWEMVVEQLVRG